MPTPPLLTAVSLISPPILVPRGRNQLIQAQWREHLDLKTLLGTDIGCLVRESFAKLGPTRFSSRGAVLTTEIEIQSGQAAAGFFYLDGFDETVNMAVTLDHATPRTEWVHPRVEDMQRMKNPRKLALRVRRHQFDLVTRLEAEKNSLIEVIAGMPGFIKFMANRETQIDLCWEKITRLDAAIPDMRGP